MRISLQAKWVAISLLTLSILGEPAMANDLQTNFASPPDATKPRCYWYWMDGHISKEGITRDLEAMRRIGIGEGYIGVISGQSGMPATGGPDALTDEWWGFIEHAIREGSRLGVDIGLFNSPGWSQSGGPWVQPDQAMRYVVLPETRITGPQQFEGKLAAPEGAFQDVAVLAFPAPEGENEVAPEASRTPRSISFETAEPFTARSLTVHPVQAVNVNAELLASEDGDHFRTIKTFVIDRHNLEINVGPVPLAPILVTFPETTARYFRLKLSGPCKLGEVRLSAAAGIEHYAEKTLIKVFQDPLPPFDFYSWPAQPEITSPALAIDPAAVRDLSTQLREDGTLEWDVPPGEWIVLRTGMMPTGTKNSPSPPEATGLEVDKMNREALKAHFDAYMGNLLNRMPPAERTAWKHVVADSYEMGPQNWTDGFAADFRARYGYDPLPWLPALTGRIVATADQSNRFLWDLRRMIADRVAIDYVGGLRDLCRDQGLRMWLENYGHWGFPSEFLKYGGAGEEISGEFWVSGSLGSIELRDAASAAHIYNMPVVWAEAFTGGPAFVNTPRDFKARGDWAFTEGINQFVLHVMIHQPWEDRYPGINAPWGTEFNRHNTWFEFAQPWVDYLRRCSVLLQAGLPVADVAYFIGEDAPKMAGIRQPALPPGYDFDYINADVIEQRLEVADGQFVLPHGVRYRILVLPEADSMRPQLLKRIEELVAQGGAVLGPEPRRSPSLENYPACDAEVKKIAEGLWGKGRVMTGNDLAPALKQLDTPPDVQCPADILWKHRKHGDVDIYFVSNQQYAERTETISFRVDGPAPELWRPDSGRIETVPCELADGRTTINLHFAPAGSVFVVFGNHT
ncbi:MAG: glycoside hydrolase family 2, partial [Candidatus Hydrogenedentes bacterium]|nr:glycoside hydrolase family 2 [Candidatus Hydrogenedentota bacterium]